MTSFPEAYQQVQDGDDVFGVHGINTPFCLTPVESQNPIGIAQYNSQLVPLPLFTLGHLGYLELLSGQLLHQLLQDLEKDFLMFVGKRYLVVLHSRNCFLIPVRHTDPLRYLEQ